MAEASRKVVVDYEGDTKRMGVNILTSTNLARIFKINADSVHLEVEDDDGGEREVLLENEEGAYIVPEDVGKVYLFGRPGNESTPKAASTRAASSRNGVPKPPLPGQVTKNTPPKGAKKEAGPPNITLRVTPATLTGFLLKQVERASQQYLVEVKGEDLTLAGVNKTVSAEINRRDGLNVGGLEYVIADIKGVPIDHCDLTNTEFWIPKKSRNAVVYVALPKSQADKRFERQREVARITRSQDGMEPSAKKGRRSVDDINVDLIKDSRKGGAGRRACLLMEAGRMEPAGPGSVLSVEEARRTYCEASGNPDSLREPTGVGADPLQPFPELLRRRHASFWPRVENRIGSIPNIFSAAVHNQFAPIQDAILEFVHQTEDLL